MKKNFISRGLQSNKYGMLVEERPAHLWVQAVTWCWSFLQCSVYVFTKI